MLPAGLIFNSAIGIISGTPTATSAATNYTVTAYNSSGSGTANVNIAVYNPLPVISYDSPQTYSAGTAITPLTPVNTGAVVATPAYSNRSDTISTFFNIPTGLAADVVGNLFVGDSQTHQVYKLTAGSGTVLPFGSGFFFDLPSAIAVDAAGNVYVSDMGTNSVYKISPDGSTRTALGSGFTFNKPLGIAVDGVGNVYVANSGSTQVYEIPAGNSTTPVALSAGGTAFSFNGPISVAVNAAGTSIYVLDSQGYIKEPVNGTLTTVGEVGLNPERLTIDASGNLFATNFMGGVMELPSGSSGLKFVGPNIAGTCGVAVDGAGNIYASTIKTRPGVIKIIPVLADIIRGFFCQRA